MFKPQVKINFEPIAFTCVEVGLITSELVDSAAESTRVEMPVQSISSNEKSVVFYAANSIIIQFSKSSRN